MKTGKAFEITSIINSIFCFICLGSTACLAIGYYCDLPVLTDIAYYFVYGWALYPVTLLMFVVCLVTYLVERKSPEAKQAIGKQWLWIFLWPLVTTGFLVFAVAELAWFMGGV